MRRTIDYFFATMSPWAYLGHARFERMAAAASADVRVRPMDLGRIFPLSGGLPLGKRAPQRQAYRLVELRRFSEWLQLPLTLQPKFFPVAGDPSARLISVVAERDGSAAAMRLSGAVLNAVWVQEREIADPNRNVAPQFHTTRLITRDGKVYQGVLIYESPEGTLIQTAADITQRISGEEIVRTTKTTQSLMPTGLLSGLADGEIADLVAYLKTLAPPR
mgnify:CR=1 FL=1